MRESKKSEGGGLLKPPPPDRIGLSEEDSRGQRSKKVYRLHKKATASALKAARWDHLNGILQTSLEEKKH